MKPAPFAYVRAESLEHALDQLARHGGDAKLIAGGQSLVPMMAMRLARPSVLVDINRLAALKTLVIGPRSVTMGAIARQRDVAEDAALHRAVPLLREALRWVGHAQTRNRGTVGGSLAHADPAAELPLAALILDATLILRSQARGERRIAAGDFFRAPMVTATDEADCLTEIAWPVWDSAGIGCAFEEMAIRHGDFAIDGHFNHDAALRAGVVLRACRLVEEVHSRAKKGLRRHSEARLDDGLCRDPPQSRDARREWRRRTSDLCACG